MYNRVTCLYTRNYHNTVTQWYVNQKNKWESYTTPCPSQGALVVKNPPANSGYIRDVGSIPESGRSPGGRHGNPLQYSCLENPMKRGAWQATVHGVTKSRTPLKGPSTHTHSTIKLDSSGSQACFNKCKLMNVIQHINKRKDRNHDIITSTDPGKAFHTIQHPFIINTLPKVGMEDIYLNIKKATQDQPTANVILNGDKLIAFQLKSGRRTGAHPFYSTWNWKSYPQQSDKKQ